MAVTTLSNLWGMPAESIAERMEPYLTQALVGNKEAYTVLRYFALHHYPEYLNTVRVIKEKYGYEDNVRP